MRVLSVVLSSVIALSPTIALARGTHGHSGHGHFSHKSSKDNNKSNPNANGKPNAFDRDTGHGRAEDRMNQNGLDHSQAGITDTDDTTTTTPPG